jgi:hypothetical protein
MLSLRYFSMGGGVGGGWGEKHPDTVEIFVFSLEIGKIMKKMPVFRTNEGGQVFP